MFPWIAAHAASFIGVGIGKSGNPCARLIAPYWFEMRVISRITDSVNVLARFAVASCALSFWFLVFFRFLFSCLRSPHQDRPATRILPLPWYRRNNGYR